MGFFFYQEKWVTSKETCSLRGRRQTKNTGQEVEEVGLTDAGFWQASSAPEAGAEPGVLQEGKVVMIRLKLNRDHNVYRCDTFIEYCSI